MGSVDIILLCALVLSLVAFVVTVLLINGKHSREKVTLANEYHRQKDEMVLDFQRQKDELSRSFEERKDSLVKDYEMQKDVLQDRIAEAEAKVSGLETAISSREAYEQQIDSERREQERIREEHRKAEMESLKDAFASLSSANSDIFKEKSAKTIEELLSPVREKFDEFTRSVKESQKDSLERHSRLEQKIEELDRRSMDVSHDAKYLADAIAGYSKVQGNFGEMLLVDILKSAGLKEGIHFKSQGVITDELGRELKSDEGKTMIPDVLIFYPDETMVVVDSKMSLNDYMAYCNAENASDKKVFAKRNTESIRKHVDELKGKDYNSYIPSGKRKVDFNIMFIPSEGAFSLMLEDDPALWQDARQNGVLIVSQMTLMIVLNMIQMLWKQKEQKQNMDRVYSTASDLMKSIEDWMAMHAKIGSCLDSAKKAYDDATRKLSGGKSSVVRKVRELEGMGVSPTRSSKSLKSSSRKGPASTVVPLSIAGYDDRYDDVDDEVNDGVKGELKGADNGYGSAFDLENVDDGIGSHEYREIDSK